METWAAVDGWEGWYEVSDKGRVRSLPRTSKANGAKANYKGKLLATPAGKNGYRTVCLSSPGRREHHSVHRLVLRAFKGPCPEGMEGCHNNGRKLDNRVVNLRYDTRRGNALDRHAHGTMPKEAHCAGEKNGMAKLTARRVRAIRASTDTQACLAKKFGVSQSTISLVRLGKSWRHVRNG